MYEPDMNKTFFSLILAAAVGLASTSCLNTDDDNSQKVILTYGGDQCFNRVVDLETGDALISGNPSYKMTFEQLKGKYDLEMSNIQLSNGYFGMSFQLPTLDYTYSSETGFFSVSAKDVSPTNANGSYVFNDFQFKMIPTRMVNGVNCPVYTFQYVVNNKFRVTTFPTTPVLLGTLTSQVYDNGVPSGETFKNNTSYLALTIDPVNMKAKVVIEDALFEKEMMTRDIVIKDMAVSISDSDVAFSTPEGQELKLYTTTDREMPQCSARDLKFTYNVLTGIASFSGHFELFDLTGVENEESAYDVDMNLSYFFNIDNIQ